MTSDKQLLMDHFWWRPGWRPGRDYLTWHVLPDATVARSLAPRRDALRRVEHLAVVRPDRLHVTGPGVGFVDDVGPSAVAGLASAARARLAHVPPFVAQLGDVIIGGNAVLVPVEDTRLALARSALREAVRDVGLEPPGDDDETYRPHLTLAYATGPARRSVITDALADVGPAEPQALAVRAFTLLALRMQPPGYQWTEIARVELGSGSPRHATTPAP